MLCTFLLHIWIVFAKPVTHPQNHLRIAKLHVHFIVNMCMLHTYVTVCRFVFTNFNTDKPTAVNGIRIPTEDITSESFVVQWDVVMDFFTITYNVTWYNEGDIVGMATVDDRLSYTVTELAANTSYCVTVVAINTCCGAGPDIDCVMIMTNNEPPTSPPSSISGNVIVYRC